MGLFAEISAGSLFFMAVVARRPGCSSFERSDNCRTPEDAQATRSCAFACSPTQ